MLVPGSKRTYGVRIATVSRAARTSRKLWQTGPRPDPWPSGQARNGNCMAVHS